MNNKHINPIEHVLSSLLNNTKIDIFDIRNAIDQWERIQNQKAVAFALENGRGDLYDLRKQDNPFHDRNLVVPLYRKIN